MNLYQSIFRRKSCRKYSEIPLSEETMQEIEDAIKSFSQLYDNMPIQHRYVENIKGKFGVRAPYYLIMSGQEQEGELENVGYIYQQLVLWFDSMDIGSVWLGGSKDAEIKDSEKDIITLAFGHSPDTMHRSKEKFSRKPISEITNAPDDICMQAVHFAPSGVNIQPWYFEKTDDNVMVYRKKLKLPMSLLYKLSDVDMGIALCHYALACKEIDKEFSFVRTSDLPSKSNYEAFGIIK